MRAIAKSILLCTALLYGPWTLAQAPAGAPAGSTGLCKDGTYWSGATKKGACHGHKGVKEWYGSTSGSAAGGSTSGSAASGSMSGSAASGSMSGSAASGSAASTPTAPTTSSGTAASARTPHSAAGSAGAPAATAAPGGGPGQVWVNHKSKVYHCSGDRWYGKTKDGEYMTEAAATAAGYRPDHGKACK